MWAFTHELLKRFREEIIPQRSGLLCREIAGVDWTDRDQVKNFYKGEKAVECGRIVGDTARLVGELLERA
jgi:hypothetical protein